MHEVHNQQSVLQQIPAIKKQISSLRPEGFRIISWHNHVVLDNNGLKISDSASVKIYRPFHETSQTGP